MEELFDIYKPPTKRWLTVGICPCCRKVSVSIKWRRQRTQYANPNDNWFLSCKPCADDNDDYWNGMWADYYSGCL